MKFKGLLVVLVAELIGLPLMSCGRGLSTFGQKDERGDATAQFLLNTNLNLASQDKKEIVRQCRLIAEQGDATAQCSLGLYYDKGDGVPQNHKEAMKWWLLAAEQENFWAQRYLGLAYYEGRGVPRDDLRAYAWFQLVLHHKIMPGENADKVNKEKVKIATIRNSISSSMTSSQKAEGERLRTEIEARIKKNAQQKRAQTP